jgi:hypothetical protein
MQFYAIQVSCSECDHRFLVGGSSLNDLTKWRQSSIECKRCGAETPARNGTVVKLGSVPGNKTGGRPLSGVAGY